jgi:hypothetical protein
LARTTTDRTTRAFGSARVATSARRTRERRRKRGCFARDGVDARERRGNDARRAGTRRDEGEGEGEGGERWTTRRAMRDDDAGEVSNVCARAIGDGR